VSKEEEAEEEGNGEGELSSFPIWQRGAFLFPSSSLALALLIAP